MSYFNSLYTGIKWTTFSAISVSLFAILKIALLTRYLDKADFGHYALVVSTLSFINLFADFGLPIAILHIKDITSKAFSSLYWLSILSNLTIYLCLLGAAPLLAHYFHDPFLQELLPIAGLVILVNSIGNLYRIFALKNLVYDWISKVNIAESIISLCSAAVLAIYGWGIWSLIYSLLLGKLVLELCFFWWGRRQLPLKFTFSMKSIKPYFEIGKYSVGGQLINYFNREIDILLIAKLGGDASILGIYSLSKQLVLKVGGIINQVIAEVTRPILPKFQDDLPRLRMNFLKIIQTISTINGIIYIIFLIFTSVIVNLLYGTDYANLVPITRILIIFAFFRNVIRFNGNLIVATGKTKLSLLMNGITLPLMVLAVWVGFAGGLHGVAWAQGLAMVILLFISWYCIIRRLVGLRLTTYLLALLPSLTLTRELLIRIKHTYERKNAQPGP